MINAFVVKAVPSSNILKVVLDGIFMKSEVELALHLIKIEKLKLKEGFNTIIDLSNFQSKGIEFRSIHYRIEQLINSNVLIDDLSKYGYGKESYN